MLVEDPTHHPLQHDLVSGFRNSGVAKVVADVEAWVVHPDRMTGAGCSGQATAIAGQHVETRLDVLGDALHVDATVSRPERARLEEREGRDVHGSVAILELEEAHVLGAESLEVLRHLALPGCARPRRPGPLPPFSVVPALFQRCSSVDLQDSC